MNARAEFWDGLEGVAYEPIPLADAAIDPFESDRIHAALHPHGLVYSGGYGRQCKPHFFVGERVREEERDGFAIRVVGRELARDLEAPPGMLIDRTLFLRQEALRRWLWEKYEEWRWSHRNEAMARAIAGLPFDTAPDTALDEMVARESESVILHELGEARAGARLGDAWEVMLLDVMRRRAEIVARAIRDLYADCLVTLPGLIERGQPAAIHFFFANFVGMRRQLFPELAEAYARWAEDGHDETLARAGLSGQHRWEEAATTLLAWHASLGQEVGAHIERKYLDP